MVLIWMVPAFGSFDQRFGFRKMIDSWFGNVRARASARHVLPLPRSGHRSDGRARWQRTFSLRIPGSGTTNQFRPRLCCSAGVEILRFPGGNGSVDGASRTARLGVVLDRSLHGQGGRHQRVSVRRILNMGLLLLNALCVQRLSRPKLPSSARARGRRRSPAIPNGSAAPTPLL